MRFVAILGVIVTHVEGLLLRTAAARYSLSRADAWFVRMCKLGNYGVHLFFMISGFILALPFLEHYTKGGARPSLPAYYLRRITRLEPPYILSMVAFFALGLATGKYAFHAHWPNFLASLIYIHNVVYGEGSLINVSAWSLEIEVQFYVLVPLLVLTFRLRPIPRRLLLVAAILTGTWLALRIPPSWPATILSFSQFFLSGFLLADLYLHHLRAASPARLYDALALLAVAAFAGVHLVPGLERFAMPATPLSFFLYGVCVFRGTWVRDLHRWAPVTVLGGMCYSVYLLHARIIYLPIRAFGAWVHLTGSFTADVVVLIAALVPVVFSVSAIYFFFVERPFMQRDWPRRFWAWVRGRVVTA